MAKYFTPDVSLMDRLLDSFYCEANGCWLWFRTKDSGGYGQLTYKNINHRAYRAMYEMFKGSVPTGLVLDHLCRNRDCVNPEHLEAVTNRENLLRGVGVPAINAKKNTCPKGHSFKDSNRGTRYCRECYNLYQNKRRALARLEKK